MWLILALAAISDAAAAGQSGEARAVLEARFQRIDRDGNGYVTGNEAPRVAMSRCQCSEAAASPSAGWIADFDEDGDERVSAGEFVSRSLRRTSGSALSQR